jgi:hypothetical protein
MADAARNLSPLTMDSKTLDSYSSALTPVYIIGGVVIGGAVLYKAYKAWTGPSQPNTAIPDANVPLLSNKTSNTSTTVGDRRTRRRHTRHRKNHSRKSR